MQAREVKKIEDLNIDVADCLKFDAKAFTKNLTHRPGVYKMLDQTDKVIYIGKAKDLKTRISSYNKIAGFR